MFLISSSFHELSRKFESRTGIVTFYLPHMEYEGSIGLVTGKIKKIIDDFYVLVLFMAKNMI
jgi:hypothetical protein